MPKFIVFTFVMSFLWIGVVVGYYIGQKSTIHKVVDFSCESIEDRKSYDMCVMTTESNLKKIKK